jgi:hypothetical protein
MAEVSGGGVTLTFFGDDADAEAPSDPSSPRGKEAVGRVWMPLDAFVANVHHLVAMVEDLREQD